MMAVRIRNGSEVRLARLFGFPGLEWRAHEGLPLRPVVEELSLRADQFVLSHRRLHSPVLDLVGLLGSALLIGALPPLELSKFVLPWLFLGVALDPQVVLLDLLDVLQKLVPVVPLGQ